MPKECAFDWIRVKAVFATIYKSDFKLAPFYHRYKKCYLEE